MEITRLLEDHPWDDLSKRILLGLVRVIVSIIAIIIIFYLGMFIVNIFVSMMSAPGDAVGIIFTLVSDNLFLDFIGTVISSGWIYFIFSFYVFFSVNLCQKTTERLIVLTLSIVFIIFIYDVRLDAPIKELGDLRSYLRDTFGCALWRTFGLPGARHGFFYVSDTRYLVFDIAVILSGLLTIVARPKE